VQFQGDDGLAHGGSGDAERLRELAFGGQPLSHFVLAFGDRRGERLGNFFVQAAGLGHGRSIRVTAARQQVKTVLPPWRPVRISQTGKGSSCIWPDQFVTVSSDRRERDALSSLSSCTAPIRVSGFRRPGETGLARFVSVVSSRRVVRRSLLPERHETPQSRICASKFALYGNNAVANMSPVPRRVRMNTPVGLTRVGAGRTQCDRTWEGRRQCNLNHR